MKIKKRILIPLIILVSLMVLIIEILSIQESMFFYPSHDSGAYSILSQNTEFEEIKISYKNNGYLCGWMKYNVDKNEVAPLLIFFGGNAQNSSATCLNYQENDIYKYYNEYNFLMVDYPGYGISDGTPSDKNMFEAATLIYD